MQDKKAALLDVLVSVHTCYLQLTLLKEHEREALEKGSCETLYELSVNERTVVDEINDLMKYVVPDLVYMKRDPDISRKLREIDLLQDQVIKSSIDLRQNLADRAALTGKRLENIRRTPGSSPGISPPATPAAINLRA
ncbi:MAG: hypothetical protein ACOC8N_06860 [Spirochaetota bacterium]